MITFASQAHCAFPLHYSLLFSDKEESLLELIKIKCFKINLLTAGKYVRYGSFINGLSIA